MKIDCHAHIMPAGWPSQKARTGYGGWIELEDVEGSTDKRMMHDDGRHFRTVQQNCYDAEAILVDMDRHNVDVMTLCTIPVLFSYWAQPADGLAWSQFLNDDLAAVISKHPKRFIGMGTVPMQNIDMAIAEMRRCRSELGFRAIEIGSNIDGINLDDPSFYPLWEAAQGIDMGIFVHPWNMVGGDRMDRYWGKWLVGMPAETTLAITSMIFGGVFDKFPRLKVMFAHAGGAFPFTLGRISHGWNCRPDLVNVHNVSDPYTYVGKFWVDSITHDRDALRYLVSLLGADRIAYGTDYPFPLGDLEHGKMIEQMDDLGDDIKTKLFSKTWLDFLGLDTSSYL